MKSLLSPSDNLKQFILDILGIFLGSFWRVFQIRLSRKIFKLFQTELYHLDQLFWNTSFSLNWMNLNSRYFWPHLTFVKQSKQKKCLSALGHYNKQFLSYTVNKIYHLTQFYI